MVGTDTPALFPSEINTVYCVRHQVIFKNSISSFQNFEVGMRTPQVIDYRHIYMTTDWEDAFAYTTQILRQSA